MPEGTIAAARFVLAGRDLDLVVLGQTEEGVPVPAKLPERLITQSGRPVLVGRSRRSRPCGRAKGKSSPERTNT